MGEASEEPSRKSRNGRFRSTRFVRRDGTHTVHGRFDGLGVGGSCSLRGVRCGVIPVGRLVPFDDAGCGVGSRRTADRESYRWIRERDNIFGPLVVAMLGVQIVIAGLAIHDSPSTALMLFRGPDQDSPVGHPKPSLVA